MVFYPYSQTISETVINVRHIKEEIQGEGQI